MALETQGRTIFDGGKNGIPCCRRTVAEDATLSVQTVSVQLCRDNAAAEQEPISDVDARRLDDRCFRRPINRHHADPPRSDISHLLLYTTNK